MAELDRPEDVRSQRFQVVLDEGSVVVFLPVLVPESAAEWRALLGSLVEAGFKDLILDTSGMPYLDSLGLAEIVRSYTVCSRASGSLTLNRISKATLDLLEVTRLLTILPVIDVDYSRVPRLSVSADNLSALVNATA